MSLFQNPTSKYQFIAIEGNIGTGKTTLAKKMAVNFGCELVLEQFTDNPFLPFFYENPERYAFPVELFFMSERHKQLEELFAQPDLFRKFTVADYFFVKTLLFAKNNLNESEFHLFQRLFKVLNSTYPKPDLLVYLHRPVEILLSQIRKRGREMEKNITGEYLEEIQKAYFDYFKTEKDTPIIILDLGEKDFESDELVFEKISTFLDTKFQKGIWHFSVGN